MIVVDVINLSSSADTLLRERVMAMRRRGIDNRIVCMDGPFVSALRGRGIPVYVVDLPRGIDPRRLATSLWRLVRLFRAIRADVVHTHCSVPGAVGRIAAWLARVPVIVHTVHGFHFEEDLSWPRRQLSRLAEWGLGRFTHQLLTQNRSDLVLAGRYGIGPRGRRRHIGNGIDLERFQPAPRRVSGTEPPVVLCVARFEPVKNHAFLLEAVARLVRAGVALRLRLVGTGELEAELRERSRTLGIDPVVEFLGYRGDIPELLAAADVAVLTSAKEGMPRCVLEAMAMGLPVVGTRVPGTREAIRHGVTGFAIEPGDVEGFAGALQRLLEDPALRAAMGARGRAEALERFDERTIIDALAELYLSVAPGSTRLTRRLPMEGTHERVAGASRSAR